MSSFGDGVFDADGGFAQHDFIAATLQPAAEHVAVLRLVIDQQNTSEARRRGRAVIALRRGHSPPCTRLTHHTRGAIYREEVEAALMRAALIALFGLVNCANLDAR